MSSKKCVGCVFLDFRKAFDNVNHPILLYKMDRYGIRGKSLCIFTLYLSNRKHYVCIDGIYSESLESTVSVPQGSCLGPLLFFIYTNDLNYLLENEVNPVLFADDTSIAYCCEDPAVLGVKLNCWLYKILDWCNYNKLALNNKKSKWMYFTRRKDAIPSLYINGSEIERVNSFKYLGFQLDSK